MMVTSEQTFYVLTAFINGKKKYSTVFRRSYKVISYLKSRSCYLRPCCLQKVLFALPLPAVPNSANTPSIHC